MLGRLPDQHGTVRPGDCLGVDEFRFVVHNPRRKYGLMTADSVGGPFWKAIVAALLLTAGTVALVWLVGVPWGPVVCPAIDPPPTNCVPVYRSGTALLVTGVVLAICVATVCLALWAPRLRGLIYAGLTVLAIAPIASYAAVSLLPGFIFPPSN